MDERLPIACSLPLVAGTSRRARWERLAARGQATLEQTPAGVRLALRRGPDLEQELRELTALERECCAFASWKVSAAGDQIVLDVEAVGDDVAAVQAMFRA
ncbi:MAG TPA: hypothetical protein VFI37_08380 [Gaiellaceae bacterium]|nr:hypothetical protein [Gaiellaceae bacterium]